MLKKQLHQVVPAHGSCDAQRCAMRAIGALIDIRLQEIARDINRASETGLV